MCTNSSASTHFANCANDSHTLCDYSPGFARLGQPVSVECSCFLQWSSALFCSPAPVQIFCANVPVYLVCKSSIAFVSVKCVICEWFALPQLTLLLYHRNESRWRLFSRVDKSFSWYSGYVDRLFFCSIFIMIELAMLIENWQFCSKVWAQFTRIAWQAMKNIVKSEQCSVN